jgi:hypothetical protein
LFPGDYILVPFDLDQNLASLTHINDHPVRSRQCFATIETPAMSEQFQVLPIDVSRAASAYPLVYLHDATITTEQWLGFVRQRCLAVAGESGLIAIRDCRGIVHALFSYRVDNDMRLRRRLCITDLFVAHLPGSDIDTAVAECARSVSAELDCQAITIERPFPSEIAGRDCPTARALRLRLG